MRKRLAWLAGILGLAALVRAARSRPEPPSAPASTPSDPADELRARLQQARDAVAAEPEPRAEPVPLEERRARVHAKAQEAIDLMREPGEGA
ncbi:MAG TPA: hypothetical protein VH950_17550 [Gaiellaceae bacterium]|jgi:hypothetical protein